MDFKILYLILFIYAGTLIYNISKYGVVGYLEKRSARRQEKYKFLDNFFTFSK